jgi:hypothetical protein
MTQLDRSVAPAIRQLEHFSILQPELHRMKNGMPLYVLSAGNEDVIRFDLLVRSGQLDQSQPLQAVFTNRMLREGTVRMTSGEIAERLDYYGAWLDLSSSVNCGFVTLYTLTKHLDRTMEIVAGLVKESVFPEEQFRIICDINRQQFLVNNQRVDVLARKQLNRSLFGTSHPLGRYAELEDYERIQVEALKDFYHRHYHSGNCSMYVSGKVTPEVVRCIERHWGEAPWGNCTAEKVERTWDIVKDARKRVHVEKEDALQSSLRMGGFSLDRKHPDYLKLRVPVCGHPSRCPTCVPPSLPYNFPRAPLPSDVRCSAPPRGSPYPTRTWSSCPNDNGGDRNPSAPPPECVHNPPVRHSVPTDAKYRKANGSAACEPVRPPAGCSPGTAGG